MFYCEVNAIFQKAYEYIMERLKRHFKFYDDLIKKNMESPSREDWMIFWNSTSYSDFRNGSDFTLMYDLDTEFDLKFPLSICKWCDMLAGSLII